MGGSASPYTYMSSSAVSVSIELCVSTRNDISLYAPAARPEVILCVSIRNSESDDSTVRPPPRSADTPSVM